MKGRISVWYMILIAVAVLTSVLVLYIAESIIQETFTDALRTAFD